MSHASSCRPTSFISDRTWFTDVTMKYPSVIYSNVIIHFLVKRVLFAQRASLIMFILSAICISTVIFKNNLTIHLFCKNCTIRTDSFMIFVCLPVLYSRNMINNLLSRNCVLPANTLIIFIPDSYFYIHQRFIVTIWQLINLVNLWYSKKWSNNMYFWQPP
jgi:hypothetical protein